MVHNSISFLDRIIAACSYLTLGTIGFLWFLLNFIMKKPLTRFLLCNLVQSFIISILYAIISLSVNTFSEFLRLIPIVRDIIQSISSPLFHTVSPLNAIILFFLGYLALFALLGKLPYIPFITDISKKVN